MNPRAQTPNTDPALGPNPAPGRSLAEEFGEAVDEMRQLHVDAGMRPYRVFVVTLEWPSGEIGRGEPRVKRETELLPTPVVDLRPTTTYIRSAGRVERGGAKLSEVSPRYTEEEIAGLFECSATLQSFVEVTVDSRDGNAKRRRFGVVGAPWRDADAFDWKVKLTTEDEARTKAGKVKGPKVYPERGRV